MSTVVADALEVPVEMRWAKECGYIADVVAVAIGQLTPNEHINLTPFHYDHLVLRRYAVMQRNAARREGFHDTAEYIEQCLGDLSWRDDRAKASFELAQEASVFRTDNDDDSIFFFNPHEAEWEHTRIQPASFQLFGSASEAQQWLEDEIAMLTMDGLDGHASQYRDMLRHGVKAPVIAAKVAGEYRLWDGHHRLAAAQVRGDDLTAYVGTPFSF